MSIVSGADSCGDVISRWWRDRTVKKRLLLAGVAAVVAYPIGDLLSALLYEGLQLHGPGDQLSFGSPVRPLMVTVILIHNVLLLAFGIGLIAVARRKSVWWIGRPSDRGVRARGHRDRHVLGDEFTRHGDGVQRHDAHHLVGRVQPSRGCDDDSLGRRVSQAGSASTRSQRMLSWPASGWRPRSRCVGSSRTTCRGQAASSGSTPTPTSHGAWSSRQW